jgi:hypothetical protein
MTEQPAVTAMESGPTGTLSGSQTVLMVAALVLSVMSFMLNATMLAPAIGDINSHLGSNAFASSTLGVTQAPEDEPGSLPGISNAAFGIGGGLGFAWAGTVVGEGTGASYHSALWICVAIGIGAIATGAILEPRVHATSAPSH